MPTPSLPIVPGDGFSRVAFPRERHFILDGLRLGHGKPMIHGFLEIDVTRARQLLRAHRERSGESFSFTAFVIGCLGKAVAAHRDVQALRDLLGRLVLFDDVDVTTIVEVEVEGRHFGLAHVVRASQRRTLREIHDEIRGVQGRGMGSVKGPGKLGARLALWVPGFLRRLVFRFLLRVPRLARRVGTVAVTAVGMFGGGVGWGIAAPTIYPLSLVVGGIAPRAATGEETSEPREILCLTVSADHAIVDGAPLARFVRDLRSLLEAADGLEEAVGTGASGGSTT